MEITKNILMLNGFVVWRGYTFTRTLTSTETYTPINFQREGNWYYCPAYKRECFSFKRRVKVSWRYPYRIRIPTFKIKFPAKLYIYGVYRRPVYTALLYSVLRLAREPSVIVSSPITYVLNREIVKELMASGVDVVQNNQLISYLRDRYPVHTIIFDPSVAYSYSLMLHGVHMFYNVPFVVVMNKDTANIINLMKDFFILDTELPPVLRENVYSFLIKVKKLYDEDYAKRMAYALDKVLVTE